MIEVAASSLRHDRAFKLPIHASHGVPEIWIVGPEGGGAVEVRCEPAGGGYAAASPAASG